MPAVSKAQQRFMGMVHAAQQGEEPASPEVAKVAKDMDKSDAKDFASTKHKGLPNKKENMNTTITKLRLKELVKEVMTEESEYQAFFAKALQKAGKGINDMTDDEKKAFFNKVDGAWNGKGEKSESIDEARDAEGNEFPELDDVKAAIKKIIQNNDVEKLLRNKVTAYLQKEKGFTGAGNTNSSRLYDKVINDLLKH